MSHSSTDKYKYLMHAWVWEACVALDFKYEASKIEKEIEDMDCLRKYYIDDKNTSLLLAIRKLEDVLVKLHVGKETLKVLTDLQSLTIFLIEDKHLQSELDIVRYLLCFHHYCVLMIYEAVREYKNDILLPSLPLNSEQWEEIKDYFKFEDDTFKEDFVRTLEVFNKCKEGIVESEPDFELFLDFLNSIRCKLTKFCSELRKLLFTPTLVKIHEDDIEYIYYKALDIPRCALILKVIKENGVTRDSLSVVFDLLRKISQDHMMLSNSEELSPQIELDSNVAFACRRKNSTISNETIISDTTSSSTMSPYGTLRFSSFLDRPMHEDSYVQNPGSSLTEQSGAVYEATVERDAEILSESFGATEEESQHKDDENILESPSAERAEPQMNKHKDDESISESQSSERAESHMNELKDDENISKSPNAERAEPQMNKHKDDENVSESLSSERAEFQMNELKDDENISESLSSERAEPQMNKHMDDESIESLSAERAEPQMNKHMDDENIKSPSAERAEPQINNQDLFHDNNVHSLESLLRDTKKVWEVVGILKTSATRVLNTCSEFEKSYSQFLESVTSTSEDQMNKSLFQYLKLDDLCKESENVSRVVEKLCEYDSTLINSAIREQGTPIGANGLNDDMSVGSELSMPVLTPQINLEVEVESDKTLEENLMSFSPQRDPTGSSNVTLVNSTRNSSTHSVPQSESSANETFSFSPQRDPTGLSNVTLVNSTRNSSTHSVPQSESSANVTFKPNTALNENNDKQVFNTAATTPFSPQNISPNGVEFNKRVFPVINESSEQQTLNISSRTAPNKCNKQQDLDISLPTAFNEDNEEQPLNTSSPIPPNSNKQQVCNISSLNDFNESNEQALNTSSPAQLNESNEQRTSDTSLYIAFSERGEQQELDNSFHSAKMSSNSETNEKSILNDQTFERFEERTTSAPQFTPPGKFPDQEVGKNVFNESSFDGNDEQVANTLSSDYTPQIESCNDRTRDKSYLNRSISENEVQTFDISLRSSSQNKYSEGERLEISSLSARSSDVSESSKGQALCSGSQNKSYKDEVTEKWDLNESSSFKDKSIEERIYDISLQESFSNNNTTSMQQDAIESPKTPSDSKLKSSPYVVLTPLKDRTTLLNITDQEISHTLAIDNESSSSPSIIDKIKEIAQVENRLSTSPFGLASRNQKHVSRLDDYQFNRLLKRRKIMELEDSFSEEEV